MASHLSDIGFLLKREEEFERLVCRAADLGTPITTPRGQYIVWSPGAGVELWVQVGEGRELVGCSPHFAGSSRVRVGVTQAYRDPHTPLGGSLYGWASPETDEPESGAHPFVFDVPDFDRVQDRLRLPRTVTVQLAAFAHELDCFPGDDAFADWQKGEKVTWAAESFLPTGLFVPDQEDSAPPRASALFAGHVRQAELRMNPVTGHVFHYLRVRTLGGEYDVVADPAIVSGEPVAGGVAQGSFWLSGRVVRPTASSPR